MSAGCFHTLSLSQFLQAIEDLHQRVSIGKGRIEITRDDCEDVCILISKAELEALEHAIEILTRNDDYRAMCSTLSELAGQCLSEPCHAPCPQPS
ncbi:MAG TPA: hypothetical protein VIM11_03420 [Tepidisphaeraceae bacterium]|jgi:hypothetical protein